MQAAVGEEEPKTEVLDVNSVCQTCGHAMKFHLDLNGMTFRQCDFELMEGSIDQPVLCGCGQFVAGQ